MFALCWCCKPSAEKTFVQTTFKKKKTQKQTSEPLSAPGRTTLHFLSSGHIPEVVTLLVALLVRVLVTDDVAELVIVDETVDDRVVVCDDVTLAVAVDDPVDVAVELAVELRDVVIDELADDVAEVDAVDVAVDVTVVLPVVDGLVVAVVLSQFTKSSSPTCKMKALSRAAYCSHFSSTWSVPWKHVGFVYEIRDPTAPCRNGSAKAPW